MSIDKPDKEEFSSDLSLLATKQRAPNYNTSSTSPNEVEYRNARTGHTHRVNKALVFLGCLIFGWLFWAIVGEWGHSLASLILPFFTLGISALIYPFYANKIIKFKWESRGYVHVEDGKAD